MNSFFISSSIEVWDVYLQLISKLQPSEIYYQRLIKPVLCRFNDDNHYLMISFVIIITKNCLRSYIHNYLLFLLRLLLLITSLLELLLVDSPISQQNDLKIVQRNLFRHEKWFSGEVKSQQKKQTFRHINKQNSKCQMRRICSGVPQGTLTSPTLVLMISVIWYHYLNTQR